MGVTVENLGLVPHTGDAFPGGLRIRRFCLTVMMRLWRDKDANVCAFRLDKDPDMGVSQN